jgi:hypothetical protein
MSFQVSSPPLVPQTERLVLAHNQNTGHSPFTGDQHITEQFSQWHLELGFPPVKPATARAFMAWRNSLRGSLGVFPYSPKGGGLNITGKTLASTGNPYSNVILVGGWSSGQASGLVVGHYLSLNNKLFQMTAVPANASGSGQCTISIEPRLRTSFAAGTAVNFVTPTGLFRLDASDGGGGGYSRDVDAVMLDMLVAIEALP